MHNLSYDLSLILQEANLNTRINVNKKQGNRFYSAQIGNLLFVDSMNMISGSLGKLAEEHIKHGGSLDYSEHALRSLSPHARNLLLQSGKQFLPYEYIQHLNDLETTSIPPKYAFNSMLKNSEISSENYNHVKNVWLSAGCRNLKDYLRYYLKCDVGLLADVYMNFRDTLFKLYGLDCLHYLTLPSIAMDAFLYSNMMKLELVHDPQLYMLLSRNIRGGFVSVIERYIKANNKDVSTSFDESSERSNYLLYMDFNSLYP